MITVLKWNIPFAEQEEITNSQVISCLLTETKLRYPTGERTVLEHNLSSGACGRGKEMSKKIHATLGVRGYFVQELDNAYNKKLDSRGLD
jgi:hypothetical protein